jgi:hypothetical protein
MRMSVFGSLLKLTLDYVRYSGVTVCLHVNPFHWSWLPVARREPGPIIDEEYTYRVSWLFVTFRFWIDDGSW